VRQLDIKVLNVIDARCNSEGNKRGVLIFSTTFEIFLILRRIQPDIITNFLL